MATSSECALAVLGRHGAARLGLLAGVVEILGGVAELHRGLAVRGAGIGLPIEAALQFRAIGAQYEDDLNRERLPPATTLDGSLALRLGPRLQLIARAENVLDATVIAGRAGNGVEERATPRTLWLGLRFRGGPG